MAPISRKDAPPTEPTQHSFSTWIHQEFMEKNDNAKNTSIPESQERQR